MTGHEAFRVRGHNLFSPLPSAPQTSALHKRKHAPHSALPDTPSHSRIRGQSPSPPSNSIYSAFSSLSASSVVMNRMLKYDLERLQERVKDKRGMFLSYELLGMYA